MMTEPSPTQSTSTGQSEDSCQSSDQSTLFSVGFRGDNCEGMEDDSETYFFESDHVALKGNPDYQRLLRSIAVLEAQRVQAVKDLDKLYEVKKTAMVDPIQFVDKLQKGSNLGLPVSQKIAELPHIEWEKYTSQLDFSNFGLHKHMTRLKKQLVDGNTEDTSQQLADVDEMVRGKIKAENRPQTFNQLWSVEEQTRLEELLIQYPPEEVESRRWAKIAAALGNRTPIQVQSRVQKYFIKLAKAGLPIPGRMPNMGLYKKKQPKNKFQKYHKFYYQQSTFLHKFEPPVYMSDDDENSQSYADSITSGQDQWDNEDVISDEDSVPIELRDTSEYRELIRLKKLRNQKQKEDSGSLTEHHGFKCDRCNCEPIVGTRWHCTDCPPDVAVDFCEECVDSVYETENHNSSHRLKPKRKTETAGYQDSDYLGFIPGGSFSGYNYLDPNYMPAS